LGEDKASLPRAYISPKEAEQRRRSLPIPVKVLNLMAMSLPFILSLSYRNYLVSKFVSFVDR
jgi:hypothetical protein